MLLVDEGHRVAIEEIGLQVLEQELLSDVLLLLLDTADHLENVRVKFHVTSPGILFEFIFLDVLVDDVTDLLDAVMWSFERRLEFAVEFLQVFAELIHLLYGDLGIIDVAGHMGYARAIVVPGFGSFEFELGYEYINELLPIEFGHQLVPLLLVLLIVDQPGSALIFRRHYFQKFSYFLK